MQNFTCTANSDVHWKISVSWLWNTCLFRVILVYQVIQSSHEGFKLMLPNAALMQRSEGGASPADRAGWSGFVDGTVQHNQVLFSASTTQRRHLTIGSQRQKCIFYVSSIGLLRTRAHTSQQFLWLKRKQIQSSRNCSSCSGHLRLKASQ